MDDEPPHLTLASSNDDAAVRKQRALDDLEWPTRVMAANLLRVMRGHGTPSDLPQQIVNLSEAILEANEVSNAWGIWNVLETVLQSAFPTSDQMDWDDKPELTAASGSLQLLASHLISQRAQEAAGRREIIEAFSDFERKREKRREEMGEAQEAYRRAQRALAAPRKQPKKKPIKKPAPTPPAPPEEPEFTGSTAEFMKKRAEQLKERQ